MGLLHLIAVAEFVPSNDPIGLTRSEVALIGSVTPLGRDRAVAMVDTWQPGDPVPLFMGRRVMLIPDDWESLP
jgi:hypothetical protein